jgi:hypothetical protein
VENEDCLNISLTLTSSPSRSGAHRVTLPTDCFAIASVGSRTAEALRAIVWAKAVLQKALRNGSLIRQARVKSQGSRVPADRAALSAVVDLIT